MIRSNENVLMKTDNWCLFHILSSKSGPMLIENN